MLWEKPVLSFGAHRGRSPLLVICSLPIFGRFSRRKNPFGKKPSSCWEKPSFVACFSSARYLFSTSLREVTSFAVGRCQEKLILREKPLSYEENPGIFGKNLFTVAYGVDGRVCVLPFLGTFSFSWPIRSCRKKLIVILRKTCLLFGACGADGRSSVPGPICFRKTLRCLSRWMTICASSVSR